MQGCVGFCYTTMPISHSYTYFHSRRSLPLLPIPSLPIITDCQTGLHVLHTTPHHLPILYLVVYTCTPVFTAAIFSIPRTWKQPRYPLTGERIKMWCVCTMGCCYSAMRGNAFESVLVGWINPEPVIQSGSKSEREKQI